MKFFKNMKVSKKLILSFLIITAFSILLACVGIFSSSSINSNYVYLIYKPIHREVFLRGVQTDFMTMRYRTANFVMNSGDVEFINGTLLPQYQSAYTSIQGYLTAFKQNINDDTRSDPETSRSNSEKAARLNELIGQYNQVAEQTLALSLAGDTVSADAMLKDAIPMTNEINALLGELIDPVNALVNEMTGSIERSANTLMVVQVAATIACLALALTLAFYISGMISKPITVMSQFLSRFGSEGDLSMTDKDNEIYAKRNKDEIGSCQEALGMVVFRLQDISTALGRIADGDLTADMNALSEKDSLGLAIVKMSESLNKMFGEIYTATAQVSTGSKQVADGAQALAQGSTEQAAAVEELSSTISEIAQKTKESAEMAGRTAALAGTIKENAEKGTRHMDKMVTAVKEINEASQSINKIIKVIDDIAFQTNILALNAAVEAARAGQHGKGFAVVAEEVRNLAAKSAEAAKDTGDLIENSMEKAELGARIADETSASLTEIVSGVNEAGGFIEVISRSADEQSAAIAQVNTGIDQVAQVVQQNSATAEESAAASEEMSGQSDMLEGLIAQFKLRGGAANQSFRIHPADASGRRVARPEKILYMSDKSGEDYGKY